MQWSREMWTKEGPDMQLGLRQVVGVVEACAGATRLAAVMPAYQFGELPGWAALDHHDGASADAA